MWVCGRPEKVQFGQFVFVAGLVLWGLKGRILAGVDALPQRPFLRRQKSEERFGFGGHERLQNEHCGFAVVDAGGATNWVRPPHARKETRNEAPRKLDGCCGGATPQFDKNGHKPGMKRHKL